MATFVVDLLVGILGNGLTWLLSAGGAVFVLVPRALWRLQGARQLGEIRFYASFREPEITRAYALPVVGLGQVLAIAAVVPSLVRVYGWFWRRPLPIRPAAVNIEATDLTGNLILFGGQSRNGATRKLLAELNLGVEQRHGSPVMSGDRIRLLDHDGHWGEWLGGLSIDGTSQELTEDYGLIVRVPNPWDGDTKGRTCVLFAGVHTYGTTAAAQYFVRQWWKPAWWARHGLVSVVRADIRDGHIVATTRIYFRRLPKN